MRKLWQHGNFDVIVLWLLTSVVLNLCFLLFTDIMNEILSLLCAHLAGCIYSLWKPLSLPGAAGVSPWRNLDQMWSTNPSVIMGYFYFLHVQPCERCLCIHFNNFFFLQPISRTCWHTWAPLHSTRAPQHNSSCGRPPHPHSISARISERAAGGSGQIGCSVRALTFGRGRKIWAVKKKWGGCWGVPRLLITTTCVHQNKTSGNIRRRGCRDENKRQTKQWKRASVH